MTDAPPPVSPRLLDRHFRWRGESVSRLEGFTDAVFAIVLALLFLRATPPENFSQLDAAMRALVPFAATFSIVGYIWVEHWIFSRRYDLRDGVTTFLNLLLLFLLLFYTYPLKFLFTLLSVSLFGPIGELSIKTMTEGMHDESGVVKLFVNYGIGYGAIFLLLAAMYLRAYRLRDRLQLDPVEQHLTRTAIVSCVLQAVVAATSVVVALCCGVAWGIPGWMYCIVGPVLSVHGSRSGRRLRALLATR